MGDWHRGALDTPIGAVVVAVTDVGAVAALGFREEGAATFGDPSPVCRPVLDHESGQERLLF